MKGLLIDDNQVLGSNLSKLLHDQGGIRCDYCPSSNLAMSMLESVEYDVLLLDIHMPEVNGNQFIVYIRNHTNPRINNIPILVLSSLGSTNDKIKSLSIGADDYIIKPFNIKELICRISGLVRRSLGHSHSVIKTGALSIDINSKRAMIGNNYIPLTAKEYELLELLMMKMNTPFSKEALLEQLYIHSFPTQKVIDVLVCKIRKKLFEYDSCDYIATNWGLGYSVLSFPVTDPKPRMEISFSGHNPNVGRPKKDNNDLDNCLDDNLDDELKDNLDDNKLIVNKFDDLDDDIKITDIYPNADMCNGTYFK